MNKYHKSYKTYEENGYNSIMIYLDLFADHLVLNMCVIFQTKRGFKK